MGRTTHRLDNLTPPETTETGYLAHYRTSLTLALGAMFGLSALLVILLPPTQQLTGTDDPVRWLSVFLSLTIVTLVAPQSDRSLWAGYPHLLAMIGWAALDTDNALVIVLSGVVTGSLLRLLASGPLRLPEISLQQVVVDAFARIAVLTGAVLTVAFVSSILSLRHTPGPHSGQSLPDLLVALASGLLAAFFITSLLTKGFTFAIKQSTTGRLDTLLWGGMTLVLVYLAVEGATGLFAGLLLLWVIQVLRQQSADNSEKPAQPTAVGRAMFDDVGETLSAHLDLDNLFDALYRRASELSHAPAFYISLRQHDTATLSYPLVKVHGQTQFVPPQEATGTVAGTVFARGTALQLSTNNGADTLAGIKLLPLEQDYPFILALPLTAGEQIVGVFCVLSDEPIGAGVRRTLDVLARQAGLAVQNALLYAQSTELVRALSLINTSIQEVMENPDRAEMAAHLAATAYKIGRADAVLIHMVEQNLSTLHKVYGIGLTPEQETTYATLPAVRDPKIQSVSDTNSPTAPAHLASFAALGEFRAITQVPILASSATLGILTLLYRAPRQATESELHLLNMLASQTASVMDNADLFQALESYAFEMAQLAHLSRVSTSNLELNHVVDDVADILRQIIVVDNVTIVLANTDKRLYTVGQAHDVMEDNLLAAVPEFVAQLKQPAGQMSVYQSEDQGLSEALSTWMNHTSARTLVATPMVNDNQLFGLILLSSEEPRQFSDREWQLLDMATNQISTHIHNAVQHTGTKQALRLRLEQLALIEDLARQISSSHDFNHIISSMLDAARQTTGAAFVALALVTEAQTLRVIRRYEMNGQVMNDTISAPKETGIFRLVLNSGKTVLVDDTSTLPDYALAPDQEPSSALAVPLLRNDTVIGVLLVESNRRQDFTGEHASFLKNLAGHAVISIDNARMLDERQYQVKTLAGLQGLALRLSSAVDTLAVARAILETAVDIFDAQEAAVFRHYRYTDTYMLLASFRKEADTPDVLTTLIPLDVVREAAETREMQILQHEYAAAQDPLLGQYACSISVPLVRGNNVAEVLCIAFDEQRSFSRRDLDALALLASQAAGHLENAVLHEQIRAGHNRLTTILTSIRDGVILLDPYGRVVEANPAVQHLLGAEFSQYVASLAATAIGNSHAPAGNGVSRQVTRRLIERRTDANAIMFVEEIGAPVSDGQQNIVGRVLVLRDVTEDKLLADYRDEITHMIVHDMRGPLASVISGINLAIDEMASENDPSIIQRTLSLSSDGAKRLMVLVESILDIAKLEAREMELQNEPITLPTLVQMAVEMLAATMHQINVAVVNTIDVDIPPLDVDVELVRRVLINLIDNALRHTPSGKQVLVGAELLSDQPGWVLIRVADSGPGIPGPERDRVFEKFKQVKQAHRSTRRGTGLGLTFCRLVVEAHGGRIWVEDEGPLPGASFAFTLPVVQSMNLEEET